MCSVDSQKNPQRLSSKLRFPPCFSSFTNIMICLTAGTFSSSSSSEQQGKLSCPTRRRMGRRSETSGYFCKTTCLTFRSSAPCNWFKCLSYTGAPRIHSLTLWSFSKCSEHSKSFFNSVYPLVFIECSTLQVSQVYV